MADDPGKHLVEGSSPRTPDYSWILAQLEATSDDSQSQDGDNSCTSSSASATSSSSQVENSNSDEEEDEDNDDDNEDDEEQSSEKSSCLTTSRPLDDDDQDGVTSLPLDDDDQDGEENDSMQIKTEPAEDIDAAEILKSQDIEKKIALKNVQLAALKTFEFVKPDYCKYKPRKNPFNQRLTVCLTLCKYDAVHRVMRRLDIQEVNEEDGWNLMWTDSCASLTNMIEMKKYQKVNHFPGMIEVCRKDLLARNMKRMRKTFPKDYDIFPETWCLPSDHGLLQIHAKKHRRHSYIMKPETGSQGRGIWVTRDASSILPSERMLCQLYISKPLLIDGFKFDLRVYVLVTNVDPLRIYVFKDGLARFCTAKYVEPRSHNVKNVYMHLTNYAVNKKSEGFVRNDESKGSKRRIRAINKWLVDHDYDIIQMWSSIDDVIIKTLVSASTALRQNYRSCFLTHEQVSACFEVLGFDIILDRNLKPYLLEVNHSPSFHTDSKLDREVKDALIHDTICLLNMDAVDRRKWLEEERKRVQHRLMTAKPPKKDTTQDINDAVVDTSQYDAEVAYENQNLGNFRRIYPSADGSNNYEKFLLTTKSIFKETAAFRARVECSRQQREDILRKREDLDILMKRKPHLRSESPVTQRQAEQRRKLKRTAACNVDSHLPGKITDRDEKRRVESMALRSRLVTSMGVVAVVGRLFDSLAAGTLIPEVPLMYAPTFRGDSAVKRVNSIAQHNDPPAWNALSPQRQTHISVLNIGQLFPTNWQSQPEVVPVPASFQHRRRLLEFDDSSGALRQSHSTAAVHQSPSVSATSMATIRRQQQEAVMARLPNSHGVQQQQQQQQQRVQIRRH